MDSDYPGPTHRTCGNRHRIGTECPTDTARQTQPLDDLILRTIPTETSIDLGTVVRLGDDVLGIGQPTRACGLTITRGDVVTVWTGGDEVAVATLPGIFAAFVQRVDR